MKDENMDEDDLIPVGCYHCEDIAADACISNLHNTTYKTRYFKGSKKISPPPCRTDARVYDFDETPLFLEWGLYCKDVNKNKDYYTWAAVKIKGFPFN